MNYRNTYMNIISKAKSENRKKLKKWLDKERTIKNPNWVYYENHHILPKSLFPLWEKRKTNMVLLTAREHFFCHQLLTKIYKKTEMLFSLWWLANDKKHGCIIGSKEYQRIKNEMIFSTPESRGKLREIRKKHYWNSKKDWVASDDYRKQRSDFMKERYLKNPELNPWHLMDKKGEKNPFFGKKHTEESLKKMRKPKNPELKINMGKASVGSKWYNNGISEIRFKRDEIIPDGFIKGRLPFSESTREKSKISAIKRLRNN